MGTISKTYSKAGSLPGQKQKITFTFSSRNETTVYVNWTFYAYSLGYDNYSYNTRHNIVYFGSDNGSYADKVLNKSFTYQAKGTHASVSKHDSFPIHNVSDSDTNVTMYYKNHRWYNGKYRNDPRTTGVVQNWDKIGVLEFPANVKYTIKYDSVLINCGKVTNMPASGYAWKRAKGNNYTVPSNKPSNYFYTFAGWSKTKFTPGDGTPDVYPNNTININSNTTFYAVWKPNLCTYNYCSFQTKVIDGLRKSISSTNIISDLDEKFTKHIFNEPTALPDIDVENNGKYSVLGYTFQGWKSSKTSKEYSKTGYCNEFPSENTIPAIINFEPLHTPNLNTLSFYYRNSNNTKREYGYYTDDVFDFSKPLSDENKSDILIKPGYKLIGWSNKILPIANPFEGLPPGNYGKVTIYPISGNSQIDYGDFNLYGYYEYYTTAYVYDGSSWKLALPYTYIDNKWKMTLSYVDYNNSWKL